MPFKTLHHITFSKQWIILGIMLMVAASTYAQSDEHVLDSALATIPEVQVISKKVSYSPIKLEYELAIRQPVDHANPEKGFFFQQLYLIHRGFSQAVVMETEGYNGRQEASELSRLLDCNDLNIEFRYFNRSKPDTLKWEYLTFEQATADLHHINQVFRKLYHSKWISTGISRGGETSLYYKYFFPADVDVTVPYVAPMTNDIEDKRIYAFLDTAGGRAVANKIKNVQVFMLQHEKEILARLPQAIHNFHYTAVGSLEAGYELAIMEYPFSFWQITNIDPKNIPTNNNLNDYYNHVMAVFGGDVELFSSLLSDENGVDPFLPHFYMTWQTGYYKYNIRPFSNYLHYLKGANPSAAFLPPNLPRKPFTGEFEKNVIDWLANEGNNILYIYGGRDTWTACKVEFKAALTSKRFVVPGASHGRARVRFMRPPMQAEFCSALEAMTGLKTNLAAIRQ